MYQPFPGAEILPIPPEVQAMYDWAASKGVRWPKIIYPVRFPPGYIGSMATDVIEPGEAIVIAPNDSLVTTKVAFQSDLKPIFEDHKAFFGTFDDMNDDLILASYILSEKAKGPGSEIAPFLAYQPKEPNNLQDWSKSELAELQDPDLMFDSEKSLELHKEQFAVWKSIFSKYPEKIPEAFLTLEEFTWAIRLIGTRTFGKFAPYTTFFPVGELLNHDNVQSYYIYLNPEEKADSTKRYGGIVDDEDHDARIYEVDSSTELTNEALVVLTYYVNQGFGDEIFNSLRDRALQHDAEELKDLKKRRTYRPADMDLSESSGKEMRLMAGATERYEKGAEVYMSYGRNSNRQLLSVYGFSLRNNHFNFAILKVKFKELLANEDLANKVHIPDFSPDIFIKFKLKEKVISMVLVRTLRKLWWEKNFATDSFFNPSNLELENKALVKAIVLLNQFLNSFSSTLEEDLELLRGELPLRKYFAVLYRSQLKEIIKNQIEYFGYARSIVEEKLSGVSLTEAQDRVFSSVENNEKYQFALKEYLGSFDSN